jgi:hypothetical protein
MNKKPITYYVDGNGCHICDSHSKGDKRYPFYTWNGRTTHMSIYIYETANKCSILKGYVVRHTCDNTGCINPAHLILGTLKENSQDMKERNRYKPLRGEQHPSSKLTDTQRAEIKMSDGTCRKIAEMYGVSKSLISVIKQENIGS